MSSNSPTKRTKSAGFTTLPSVGQGRVGLLVSPEVKDHYLTKIRFSSIPQEPTHLEKAARELLQAKRPATAVRLLAMGMYNKDRFRQLYCLTCWRLCWALKKKSGVRYEINRFIGHPDQEPRRPDQCARQSRIATDPIIFVLAEIPAQTCSPSGNRNVTPRIWSC
jgi:hypothetical protein